MSNDKVYNPYTLPGTSGLPAGAYTDEVTGLMTKFNNYLVQEQKLEKNYYKYKSGYEQAIKNSEGIIAYTQVVLDTGVYKARLVMSGDPNLYTAFAAGWKIFVSGERSPYFGSHVISAKTLESGSTVFYYSSGTNSTVSYVPSSGRINVDIDGSIAKLYRNYMDTLDELKRKRKNLDNLKKLIGEKIPSLAGKPEKSTDSSGTWSGPDDSKPVKMNLPGIRDSYFSQTGNYETEVLFTTAGNRPSVDITKASQLWINAGSTGKGMIQSYVIPKAVGGDVNKSSQPELYKLRDVNKSRYAFRFIYNPSTISMGFAGSPAVDIGLEISGRDKIPLVGSAASSSTISFQLMLNRMPDMRYLTDKSRDYNFKSLYGVDPSDEELAQIRDRGTMYDVEFLLRTLIGYALPSQLRKFTTSDIGYLGAYPVELHLGKSLRYLVTIAGFDINHTIFTKDMVPVFTNVAITCNRLPDFPYSANTKSALEKWYGSSSTSSADTETK